MLVIAVLSAAGGVRLSAEQAPDSLVTLHRLFETSDFDGEGPGQLRWLPDGAGYTMLESPGPDKSGRDLVRYDAATGARTVLVTATQLTPPGADQPLQIAGYSLAADGQKAADLHQHPAGLAGQHPRDYWVLDRSAGTLRQLGGVPPSRQP